MSRPTTENNVDRRFQEIVISATHDVNHVSLSGNLSTTIINKAGGITSASTGGIGTTLFYVIGGGLMVAAIVLLVTRSAWRTSKLHFPKNREQRGRKASAPILITLGSSP